MAWQLIDTAHAEGRTDGRDLLVVLPQGRQVIGHWRASPAPGTWVAGDEQPIAPTHYQDLLAAPPQTPPPSTAPAPPVLTSLVPESAALGSPNFTLRVLGTGFTQSSVIIWNGAPETTSFASPTELTTGVNMATAQVAMPIPLTVQNPGVGVLSNVLTFTLTEAEGTPAAEGAARKATPAAPTAKRA